MPSFRDSTIKDEVVVGVVVFVFAVATLVGGLFFAPRHPFLFIGGIVAGVGALAVWHAASFGYRCPECKHEFEIPAWKDLISPHIGSTKYLRCPGCGRKVWADAIVKTRDRSTELGRKTAGE
jgi:DNA-directed RNA polymerase subunit RPC12/RpoP